MEKTWQLMGLNEGWNTEKQKVFQNLLTLSMMHNIYYICI